MGCHLLFYKSTTDQNVDIFDKLYLVVHRNEVWKRHKEHYQMVR
jgi:hypothetical protein